MPICVTNAFLEETKKNHPDPRIQHAARELLGLRKLMAKQKAANQAKDGK